MNLNYLKYFITVAELKSFTEASERLFITQPSLSVSIQKLENNLGVKLFNRNKKGQKSSISLTSSGKYFLDKAKDILAQFESVKVDLHHDCLNPKILKLGTLPTLSINLVAQIIVNLRKAYPNMIIEQVNGNSLELESWLAQGDIDIAVKVFSEKENRVKEAEKTSQILFEQSYLVAVAKEHPLAKKPSFSVEELNRAPYIDRIGCEIRQDLQKVFRERSICPKITGRTQHSVFANSLIASGAGLAIIPDRITIPGVITLPFSDFSITRLVGFKWRADEDSDIIRFFRQFSSSRPLDSNRTINTSKVTVHSPLEKNCKLNQNNSKNRGLSSN